MQCAVCNVKVDNFKLQNFKGIPEQVTTAIARQSTERLPSMMDTDEERDAYSHSMTFVPSALEDGFDEFIDRAQGASTPVAGARSTPRSTSMGDERVILRIDNVPWVNVPCLLVLTPG